MEQIFSALENILLFKTDFLLKSGATLSSIGILYLIKKMISWIGKKTIKEDYALYRLLKGINYILNTLLVFWVLKMWLAGMEDTASFVGFFSVGLAFVLRDLLLDIFGCLFITFGKIFEVGDRIQIGNDKGDVVDIRLFQFSIMEIGNWVDSEQSTGRIIHIPTSSLFTNHQINYTKGYKYIWNEIPVRLTFSSNWKRARKIMENAAKEYYAPLEQDIQKNFLTANRQYMIQKPITTTPKVYLNFQENGICLSLRYLCIPKNRRDSQNFLIEKILEEFTKTPDIHFSNTETARSETPLPEK